MSRSLSGPVIALAFASQLLIHTLITQAQADDAKLLAETFGYLRTQIASVRHNSASGEISSGASVSYTLSVGYEPLRFDRDVFEWRMTIVSGHNDDGERPRDEKKSARHESVYVVTANVRDIDPASVRVRANGRPQWGLMDSLSFTLIMDTYNEEKAISYRRISSRSEYVDRHGCRQTEEDNSERPLKTSSATIIFDDRQIADGCAEAFARVIRLCQGKNGAHRDR